MPDGKTHEVDRHPRKDRAISEAMGSWLADKPWDVWVTLTFRDGNFSHEAATRAFQKWIQWLGIQGNPNATHFVGHEIGGHTARLHLHGLIGNLEPCTSRNSMWEWWFKRYGRAQILPYDPEKGAAHYVSKYITKELAHWDLDFDGWTRQNSLKLPGLTIPTLCENTRKPHRPRRPSTGVTSIEASNRG